MNNNGNQNDKLKFTKVGEIFIIAQDRTDPERVMFFWNPMSDFGSVLWALTRTWADKFPPVLQRMVQYKNGTKSTQTWDGCYWDDHMDSLIKSLAESFIDLRFASPDRTQINVQTELWPESDK